LSCYAVVAGGIRHLSGWKRDTPDHRDYRIPAPTARLPARTDLRPLCPPVGDQGPIGSCTANSSCEALEFLERMGPADRLFSRLFLYYYTRKAEGTPASADSGAQIRTALTVLGDIGVPYEQVWPDEAPRTRFSVEPSADAKREAAKHRVLFYYRCPTLPTVKASLAQGFPVVFGFSVPDNMMTDRCAKDGLVYYPEPNEGFQGGHAVLAVGYDDARIIGTQHGAVLVQNSWGTSWGQEGYFWLPYPFFTNADPFDPNSALATDCWTIRRAAL
jgi:C1A family cysteine protease